MKKFESHPESTNHDEEELSEKNLAGIQDALSVEAAQLKQEPDPKKRSKRFIDSVKKVFKSRITKGIGALLVTLGAAAHYKWPHETEAGALATPGVHELYEELILTPTEKKLANEIRDHLGELVGNFALSEIELLDSVSSKEERERLLEYNTPQTEFSGFEFAKECGLTASNDEIREVFFKSLPRGMVLNVNRISYNPEVHPFLQDRAERIFLGQSARFQEGFLFGQAKIETRSIEIFKNNELSNQELIWHLTHEATHLADWRANKLLTREERMQLLLKVLTRLEADNAFDSPQLYVKNIQGPWDDATKYAKAPEYIAEDVCWYLENRGRLVWEYPSLKLRFALPAEDIQLVEDLFATLDPQFNRDSSFGPRWEIQKRGAQ